MTMKNVQNASMKICGNGALCASADWFMPRLVSQNICSIPETIAAPCIPANHSKCAISTASRIAGRESAAETNGLKIDMMACGMSISN
ncbi:hypothetical protein D3C78_1521550 [compost metagenome]